IKFSPEQERVTVGARRSGAELEIWVSDHGRGIAADDVGRLFKKFQQLDGSNVRSVGGTGLGLAICRGIVEEHGGAIGVESRVGHGATFTVTLPLPVAAGELPPAEGETAVGDSPLFLVLNYERDIRGVLHDQLELEGFRVLEAGWALEAVEVS